MSKKDKCPTISFPVCQKAIEAGLLPDETEQVLHAEKVRADEIIFSTKRLYKEGLISKETALKKIKEIITEIRQKFEIAGLPIPYQHDINL